MQRGVTPAPMPHKPGEQTASHPNRSNQHARSPPPRPHGSVSPAPGPRSPARSQPRARPCLTSKALSTGHASTRSAGSSTGDFISWLKTILPLLSRRRHRGSEKTRNWHRTHNPMWPGWGPVPEPTPALGAHAAHPKAQTPPSPRRGPYPWASPLQFSCIR